MLNISDIRFPTEHVSKRARAMWATKYDSGERTITYRVVPHGPQYDHKTKDRRLVLFDLKRGVAECLSLETGEVCEANSYKILCSHVLRAYQVMEKGSRKKAA